VWALLLARRRPLAFALTIPPLLLGATIGHAAAFTPMWSVPMKSLHLAALAAWLGGLLWLSMCDRTEPTSILREATRVSNVALISVVTIALSGIGQAYVLLHTLDNIGSTYGAVVIAKVLGLGILVAFGAFHRFRVLPRLAEQAASAATGFAKSLRAEIAVMWLVILIGGALAYIPPPEPDMNPRGESHR
jgi:putative copper export protein